MSYESYDSNDNSKKNPFTKLEFLPGATSRWKRVLPFEDCTIYLKTIKIHIWKTSWQHHKSTIIASNYQAYSQHKLKSTTSNVSSSSKQNLRNFKHLLNLLCLSISLQPPPLPVSHEKSSWQFWLKKFSSFRTCGVVRLMECTALKFKVDYLK